MAVATGDAAGGRRPPQEDNGTVADRHPHCGRLCAQGWQPRQGHEIPVPPTAMLSLLWLREPALSWRHVRVTVRTMVVVAAFWHGAVGWCPDPLLLRRGALPALLPWDDIAADLPHHHPGQHGLRRWKSHTRAALYQGGAQPRVPQGGDVALELLGPLSICSKMARVGERYALQG